MFLGANHLIFIFGLFFLVSIFLTYLVRKGAIRLGFVSVPDGQRWNERVVSLGGGISLMVTIFLGMVWIGSPLPLGILPPTVGIFLLGIYDDIWGVGASGKLIFQAVAASYVVSQGYLLPIPWPVAAIALTILWIVGMTNSLNLVDNMDGLSAGTTLVSVLGIASLLALQPETSPFVRLSVVIGAAALGFLVHNFHPAKIFMGDSGSLSLGFLLATLSTKLRFSSDLIPQPLCLVLIALILIVPIFDTFLVIVARSQARRPWTSGGRDHTSHRLVRLGLSEKKSVLILYLFAILGALAAYFAALSTLPELLAITVTATILVTLFFIFLLEVIVYPPSETFAELLEYGSQRYVFPLPVMYILELALDVGTISLSWASAHIIRFQDAGIEQYYSISAVIPLLPYVITCKLIAFSLLRIYWGNWSTVQAKDVYRLFKAASLATLLLLGGLALVTRLGNLSRIVIVIDWLLTFMGLMATRASLTGFRRWFRKMAATPIHAAFLGPASLYHLAQEVSKEESGIIFSGVIATEKSLPKKSDDFILGLSDDVENIIKTKNIKMLFVVSDIFDSQKAASLIRSGISIRRVKLQFA